MYRNILFVCVINAIASQTKAGIFSKLQLLKRNQNQKSSNSAPSKPVIDYFVPDYHWLNYFSPMLGFIHYGKSEEDPSFYFYNNEKNARFKYVDPNLIEQREIEKAIEHKYLEEEVLKHQLGNALPNSIPNTITHQNQPFSYHYQNQGYLFNNPISNKPPPIPPQVVEPNRPLVDHQIVQKPVPNHPIRNHLLNRPLRNQILNQALKHQQYFPSSTYGYGQTPEELTQENYYSTKKMEKDPEEEHQKEKMKEMEEKEQQRVKDVIENLRQIVLDIRNLQQQQVQEVKQIFRQKEPTTTPTMTTTTSKSDDQVKVIESLHQLVQTIREIQQQQAREAEELRKQKQQLSTTTTTPKPVENYQISNPFYEHVSKPHDFVEEPGFYYVFLKEKDEFKPSEKGEVEKKTKQEVQQETIINVPETTTYKSKFRQSSFGEYIRNNIPKLVNDNINGRDTESGQYKDGAVSYFIQELPEETTKKDVLNPSQIYIVENQKSGEGEKNINMFLIDTSTNEDLDNINFLIDNANENLHQNLTDFSDGKREKFAYRIRHHLDDSRSKLKNYWHS